MFETEDGIVFYDPYMGVCFYDEFAFEDEDEEIDETENE